MFSLAHSLQMKASPVKMPPHCFYLAAKANSNVDYIQCIYKSNVNFETYVTEVLVLRKRCSLAQGKQQKSQLKCIA